MASQARATVTIGSIAASLVTIRKETTVTLDSRTQEEQHAARNGKCRGRESYRPEWPAPRPKHQQHECGHPCGDCCCGDPHGDFLPAMSLARISSPSSTMESAPPATTPNATGVHRPDHRTARLATKTTTEDRISGSCQLRYTASQSWTVRPNPARVGRPWPVQDDQGQSTHGHQSDHPPRDRATRHRLLTDWRLGRRLLNRRRLGRRPIGCYRLGTRRLWRLLSQRLGFGRCRGLGYRGGRDRGGRERRRWQQRSRPLGRLRLGVQSTIRDRLVFRLRFGSSPPPALSQSPAPP